MHQSHADKRQNLTDTQQTKRWSLLNAIKIDVTASLVSMNNKIIGCCCYQIDMTFMMMFSEIKEQQEGNGTSESMWKACPKMK